MNQIALQPRSLYGSNRREWNEINWQFIIIFFKILELSTKNYFDVPKNLRGQELGAKLIGGSSTALNPLCRPAPMVATFCSAWENDIGLIAWKKNRIRYVRDLPTNDAKSAEISLQCWLLWSYFHFHAVSLHVAGLSAGDRPPVPVNSLSSLCNLPGKTKLIQSPNGNAI